VWSQNQQVLQLFRWVHARPKLIMQQESRWLWHPVVIASLRSRVQAQLRGLYQVEWHHCARWFLAEVAAAGLTSVVAAELVVFEKLKVCSQHLEKLRPFKSALVVTVIRREVFLV
jgi:hypothetical protein